MSASNPSSVPALAPPAGITPNFVNPYTLSPAFVATAVICLLSATAALIIRLATSLYGSDKRLRIEDCMLFQHLNHNIISAHADLSSYMYCIMGRWISVRPEVLD